MNGTSFKLATLAKPNANAFAVIVLGADAVELKTKIHRKETKRVEHRPHICLRAL